MFHGRFLVDCLRTAELSAEAVRQQKARSSTALCGTWLERAMGMAWKNKPTQNLLLLLGYGLLLFYPHYSQILMIYIVL
jgi:hypothetical protein